MLILSKLHRFFWGGGAIRLHFLKRKANLIYRKLGADLHPSARLSKGAYIRGNYSNISMHKNSEVNVVCFLLTTDRIEIGENSTVAYKAIILTSANPNAPLNLLSKIYKPKIAPVKISKNVWIGAGAIILPGVEVGDFSVVAAGAIVTKNVPSGVMVAGNPAQIKKKLTINE